MKKMKDWVVEHSGDASIQSHSEATTTGRTFLNMAVIM